MPKNIINIPLKSASKFFRIPRRQSCMSCSRHSFPSSPPPGHLERYIYHDHDGHPEMQLPTSDL